MPTFSRLVCAVSLRRPWAPQCWLSSLSSPQTADAGDDGKNHVAYELLAVSVFGSPITAESEPSSTPLTHRVAETERRPAEDRHPVDLHQEPLAAIPASRAGTIEIALIVPPGTAPAELTHGAAYTFGDDPLAPMIVSREIAGPQVKVDTRQPLRSCRR